nr:MAG TPA: hypothetical protein [Microviridae sp.]
MCAKQIRVILSNSPFLVYKRTTHTQLLKKKSLKYFVYSKIMFSFAPVETNSLNY